MNELADDASALSKGFGARKFGKMMKGMPPGMLQ